MEGTSEECHRPKIQLASHAMESRCIVLFQGPPVRDIWKQTQVERQTDQERERERLRQYHSEGLQRVQRSADGRILVEWSNCWSVEQHSEVISTVLDKVNKKAKTLQQKINLCKFIRKPENNTNSISN